MKIIAYNRLHEIADKMGMDCYIPPYNEEGEMEGVPHIWKTNPPMLIIFTDQIGDPMNTLLYKDGLPEEGINKESHEWLTANEFLKIYEYCTHVEFRSMNELLELTH